MRREIGKREEREIEGRTWEEDKRTSRRPGCTIRRHLARADADARLPCYLGQNAFDNFPWIKKLVAFVQTILAQDRVRIIGVCFGHQIVGRALGARVDRGDKGWEMSVTPMELTERGKELFGLDKLVCEKLVAYELS